MFCQLIRKPPFNTPSLPQSFQMAPLRTGCSHQRHCVQCRSQFTCYASVPLPLGGSMANSIRGVETWPRTPCGTRWASALFTLKVAKFRLMRILNTVRGAFCMKLLRPL